MIQLYLSYRITIIQVRKKIFEHFASPSYELFYNLKVNSFIFYNFEIGDYYCLITDAFLEVGFVLLP